MGGNYLKVLLAAGGILFATGCSTEMIEAAEMNVYMDVSKYSVLTSSEPLREDAIEFVQQQADKMMTGDQIRFRLVGANDIRIAERKTEILTDLSRPMENISPAIAAAMLEMTDPFLDGEGEDWTNILASVQTFPPDCSSGRNLVLFITDGMENGDDYSAQHAIATSAEIELPIPAEPFLEGCNVVVWGLGISSRNPETKAGTMLTPRQIAVLKDAWRVWFEAAGAESIVFLGG